MLGPALPSWNLRATGRHLADATNICDTQGNPGECPNHYDPTVDDIDVANTFANHGVRLLNSAAGINSKFRNLCRDLIRMIPLLNQETTDTGAEEATPSARWNETCVPFETETGF